MGFSDDCGNSDALRSAEDGEAYRALSRSEEARCGPAVLSERKGMHLCVLPGIPAVWRSDFFHSLDWGRYHINVPEL